jgi:hypothetical protein
VVVHDIASTATPIDGDFSFACTLTPAAVSSTNFFFCHANIHAYSSTYISIPHSDGPYLVAWPDIDIRRSPDPPVRYIKIAYLLPLQAGHHIQFVLGHQALQPCAPARPRVEDASSL